MPTICIEPVDIIHSSDDSYGEYDKNPNNNTKKIKTEEKIRTEVKIPKKSPSNSICSQNISITTLDADDVESSSVAESDLEYDDDDEVASLPGGRQHNNEIVLMDNESTGGSECVVASSSSAAIRPNIGSIAVQNSSDITFGNKTFYQGPVTIKQYIKDNNKWTPSEQANDNPNFVSSNGTLAKDSPTSSEETKSKVWYRTKRPVLFTLMLSVLALLIASVTLTILFLRDDSVEGSGHAIGDGDDYRPNIPINTTIGDDIITDGSSSLRMVARDEWLAQPPNKELTDLNLPANRVIIAHSATENCTSQAMCVFRVRIMQTFHMESRGWDDIGYNFLVGGDGNAYEGRGWNKQGAHTKGFNDGSICIAFIGTFTKLMPPQRQLNAAQQIISQGIKLKKLTPDYRLYGQRQLAPTESPGTSLYEIIAKWSHWANDLKKN